MKKIYLKTTLVEVKVSSSTKSPDINMSSVVKVVTLATCGTDTEMNPYKSPFEVDSIVEW